MDRLKEANQANREATELSDEAIEEIRHLSEAHLQEMFIGDTSAQQVELAPALLKNTYTVEFFNPSNNLTICVDVVSTDKNRAMEFARERFNLDKNWELVGSDRKYE